VDGLGRSNLIEVIRLMKCGGLTREEVEKNLLCFGAYGTFVF
jgi:recombinational DNA repair ATPase RecF